eukprot:TRINITY_DN32264_c0_g1_i1.p1 TRINITY_DN32264_c0_g1~~TRINITY_DN32264_c0_g1_i1.p1  ORF type:complete len:112 (-),score=19.58 TRINITY_DN32264_c0_g1_i1:77-412(-)
MTNSSSRFPSEGFESHCWEPDGSFHSVCIFVIGMSSVCVILTVIAVYRIGEMVLQLVREGPDDSVGKMQMVEIQKHRNSNETETTVSSARLLLQEQNHTETVVEINQYQAG